MKRRVLIIGIDGGTWRILGPAMDEGYMPCLKNLVDRGASGVLKSTVPAITPAAWGTFQTGANPGNNGVFSFTVWDKQGRREILASSLSLSKTVWEILGQMGKRVALVDVPMTYPPREINGYIVTGFPTPSLQSNFTHPEGFKRELLSAVPEYEVFDLSKANWRQACLRFEAFVRNMVQVVDSRVKVACYIVKKEPTDVLMVHFQATDWVQHALWCYLDEQHAMYDPAARTYILERFYSVVDRAIETIIDTLEGPSGRSWLTLVVSDHGFQMHRYRFNLGKWLHEAGFLAVRSNVPHHSLWIGALKRLDFLRLRDRISFPSFRSAVNKVAARLAASEIDDGASRALALSAANEGIIYVLGHGPSYEATLGALKESLAKVVNPATGERVVQDIRCKSELYKGQYLHLAPDLVAIPTPGYSFTGGYSPGVDLFQKVRPGTDFHLGKHHQSGVLIASGPGIRKKCRVQAALADIAPTLLSYMNLPIPDTMDGRVLKELFVPGFESTSEVVYSQDDTNPDLGVEAPYSDQGRAVVEGHLRNLGYLD